MTAKKPDGVVRRAMLNRAHRLSRRHIDGALEMAHAVAMLEIERLARAAMRNPSSGAHEFCMAMGTAAFYGADGNPLDIPFPYPHWAARLHKFIDDYDGALKLTGSPMRIQGADGPVLSDW